MSKDLSPAEYAAMMYSCYRMYLDCGLYHSAEEKADMEKQLQAYEDYYLQVQDENILHEILTPIFPTGGHPPPGI